MKRFIIQTALLIIMTAVSPAMAIDFAGVSLPDSYQLSDQTLQLNGQGMRKKFFFSIYIGALYTPEKVTSSSAVMNPQLPKVIRMHFIYDEVSAEKLRNGFAESIDNNIPGFSKTADAQEFLNLFDFDAVKNDTVDMQFTPDGTLTVRHNDKQIGQIRSMAACNAVLNVYFGPEPIESLKKGMLGS